MKDTGNISLTACSSLPRKKCGYSRLTDRPPMTIAVDWDVKQQNKQTTQHYLNNIDWDINLHKQWHIQRGLWGLA